MGYSERKHSHGTIKSYWPDDTEDTMYLTSSSQHSLAAIIELCREKWPDADFNDLLFESGEIHDLYDPMDYTDFIIISRVQKKEDFSPYATSNS